MYKTIDGGVKLHFCHLNPPVHIPLPNEQGKVNPVPLIPTVREDSYCSKWRHKESYTSIAEELGYPSETD